MDRQHALELLTASKPVLQERFGVTRLALFGSTARDTALRPELRPYVEQERIPV